MFQGLDFETFGSRDLRTVGLDNYIRDPLFTPLLASRAYRLEDGNIYFNRYRLLYPNRMYDLKRDYLEDTRKHILDGFAAHNASFERRVIKRSWNDWNPYIVDTATMARINGASSSLEKAGPQLLGLDKVASGKALIQKFCVGSTPPGEEIYDDEDWPEFEHYCDVDAELSLLLAETFYDPTEDRYEQLTDRMNQVGWTVDMEAVHQMKYISELNKERALDRFREEYDPKGELNLNSLKQLKEWCRDHKVAASSFDEEHVEELIQKIERRVNKSGWTEDLEAVHDLLLTKQTIGGAALKKLPVIENLTAEDDKLRNQYLHCGAGQTRRTTGYGVQMQNLKRLGHLKRDMEELFSDPTSWTNDQLAENMRQLFTASHPDGFLLVGDFSSVESRGLAYLAGQYDKLDAYRQGMDQYKVGAAKHYGIDYEDVTKDQRTFGKVGELSCGYQAGPGAVRDFAKKMGVILTPDQAGEIVNGWRSSNPQIVELWSNLDQLLHDAVNSQVDSVHLLRLAHGLQLEIVVKNPPKSLTEIHPGCKTLELNMYTPENNQIMSRVFQGVYLRGNTICYYKPSDRVTGPAWVREWKNPKTKRMEFFTIYGGKLSGILTQSFCREIYFSVLSRVEAWVAQFDNLKVIGQFHDEIILDWVPAQPEMTKVISLSDAEFYFHAHMGTTTLREFPLDAAVGVDYRYTK